MEAVNCLHTTSAFQASRNGANKLEEHGVSHSVEVTFFSNTY